MGARYREDRQSHRLKGKLNEKEGVYRVTFPRADVKIAVDGWTMPPFMGLGTWAAFTETKAGAMVMGDTVLFEDEVNPVMSVALENGLSVTALHNHFFFDQPKVYFMHIEGRRNGRTTRHRRSQGLRQDQRNPRGQPATERFLWRGLVAGKKFDFGGAAKQSLRNEW